MLIILILHSNISLSVCVGFSFHFMVALYCILLVVVLVAFAEVALEQVDGGGVDALVGVLLQAHEHVGASSLVH